jgi:RNA polymerase sigma-70 factor (ECF subfamily)
VAAGGITDELVAAAQAGDTFSLREIYFELAGAVCGYLRAKGVPDPEGVTSDVFLAVLPKLGTVTGGASGLRKFVFSVAHARMVDVHRAEARMPDLVEYEPDLDSRAVDAAELIAEEELGTERVLEILSMLPDEQREVLTLRVVADLSLDQVASIVGKSVGAVKQLQRRALLTVRDALTRGRVTL